MKILLQISTTLYSERCGARYSGSPFGSDGWTRVVL
jgi:hypothetical protein